MSDLLMLHFLATPDGQQFPKAFYPVRIGLLDDGLPYPSCLVSATRHKMAARPAKASAPNSM